MSVKKTRIKIGDCSFTIVASILWNALPCQIEKARTIDDFKSMIKTNNIFSNNNIFFYSAIIQLGKNLFNALYKIACVQVHANYYI